MVEKVNERVAKLLQQVANFDLPYGQRMTAAEALRNESTGSHTVCTMKIRNEGCFKEERVNEYEFSKAPIDPNAFILSNDDYFEEGTVTRARIDVTATRPTFEKLFAKSGYSTYCRIEDNWAGSTRNHLICRNEKEAPTSTWEVKERFCFPAETLLLTNDGTTMSMREYAALWEVDPSAVPAVATYDENGKLVYQKPIDVLDHGIQRSTLLYLGLEDETANITPLRVTDNHPLLVDRGGYTEWVEAGDLTEGDMLVGPAGEYRFDEDTTMAVEGAFALYNLEFEGPHTYLVSPDGANWFVAHNKMY